MRAALLLLVLAAPASAQVAGQWRGPEHIWGATCGYCHAEGVGPEIRGRGIDAGTLRTVVRQGLPGMPNFHPSEISDRELTALAAWIATQQPTKPK